MERLLARQEILLLKLEELEEESEKEKEIVKYIKVIEDIGNCFEMATLFKEDSEQQWLNVSHPLKWEEDLRGKVLVLDFFTYCCLNCLHLLPVLERLEKTFPIEEGLVVVGVHSAKFLNEKVTANVASAILQNGISHAVLNDPQALLWNRLQIQCWPTLLIIGPSGEPLFIFMGEGHEEELSLFCRITLDYFRSKDALSCHPLPLKLLKDLPSRELLKFPGKVACIPECEDIVVADTGNNRILILSAQGIVKDVIGGSEQGYKDGSFESALFNKPQGVTVKLKKEIYVADTGNHSIRLIDLTSRCVTTVVGTGLQGFDRDGGNNGTDQPISSPWDLCLGPPFGNEAEEQNNDSILYIAMAGLHQIWGLALQDVQWPRGRAIKSGSCFRVAGNGNEENKNNNYPHQACFAQPSGLTYSRSQRCLYVADSESSTIRSISLKDGSVKGLVGGALDPKDLFAFGDADGSGIKAKLQHPLGVAWSEAQQLLYIADTYNHKVKVFSPETKVCSHLAVNCTLREPGGLCLAGTEHLLVADTQNHGLLKVALNHPQLTSSQISVVMVDAGEDKVDSSSLDDSSGHPDWSFVIQPGGQLFITFSVELEEGLKFSKDAPQKWSLQLPNSEEGSLIKCSSGKYGNLNLEEGATKIDLQVAETVSKGAIIRAKLCAKAYVCDDSSNVCLSRGSEWIIHISIENSGKCKEKFSFTWRICK